MKKVCVMAGHLAVVVLKMAWCLLSVLAGLALGGMKLVLAAFSLVAGICFTFVKAASQ